jgi:L-alanine-DL-glutamate epimerase-like enolase superfamily enzyme
MPTTAIEAAVEHLDVSAYQVPTDAPESDGTLRWDSTTMVVVEVSGGGEHGIGWTYADGAAGALVEQRLAEVVRGRDALDVPAAWAAMRSALRNDSGHGLGGFAIAAVDVALWDLKARLLGLPLARLLGRVRRRVALYGSGGFTTYSVERLCEQLAGWVEDGFARVKMKVGADAAADPGRVAAARRAIGPDAELFVDANGAWHPDEAIAMAERFATERVSWLEEPVSSDDVGGLRRVRDRVPPGMAVAAGEYVTAPDEALSLIEAVDVLQVDVTRCAGITGLLIVDGLCVAHARPSSLHCAPTIHAQVGTAMQSPVHLEWFHDHVRLERMVLDGFPALEDGCAVPDAERPGLGVELRRADADRYAL